MLHSTNLSHFLGHFIAYHSHFSSGYTFFHCSRQQASATSGTQHTSLSKIPFVPAQEAAISGAWENWKDDAPTMENTSVNYTDAHLHQLSK